MYNITVHRNTARLSIDRTSPSDVGESLQAQAAEGAREQTRGTVAGAHQCDSWHLARRVLAGMTEQASGSAAWGKPGPWSPVDRTPKRAWGDKFSGMARQDCGPRR